MRKLQALKDSNTLVQKQTKANTIQIKPILQISKSHQETFKPSDKKQNIIQNQQLQFNLRQQEKIIQNIKTATQLFNKKYFGNKVSTILNQKKRIIANPSTNFIKNNEKLKKVESLSLLPQMKEIQMIFRTESKQNKKRRLKSKSNMNTKLTPFELYQAKKNMIKQNMKLIELKTSKTIVKQAQKINIEEQKNEVNSKQPIKNEWLKILKPLQKQIAFSKKIKSQRQLLSIFEQKIIKQKFQKPIFSLRQFLNEEKRKNPTEDQDNFQQNIKQIQKVAKQMVLQYKTKSQIQKNSKEDSLKHQSLQQTFSQLSPQQRKYIQEVVKKKEYNNNKTKFVVKKSKSISQLKRS